MILFNYIYTDHTCPVRLLPGVNQLPSHPLLAVAEKMRSVAQAAF
jgi:hypothetical protein